MELTFKSVHKSILLFVLPKWCCQLLKYFYKVSSRNLLIYVFLRLICFTVKYLFDKYMKFYIFKIFDTCHCKHKNIFNNVNSYYFQNLNLLFSLHSCVQDLKYLSVISSNITIIKKVKSLFAHTTRIQKSQVLYVHYKKNYKSPL